VIACFVARCGTMINCTTRTVLVADAVHRSRLPGSNDASADGVDATVRSAVLSELRIVYGTDAPDAI
jgi:hypothetical protein